MICWDNKRTYNNKKTNEVTSEQLLAWAKRVEAQSTKKAITDTTKRVKISMPWKKQELYSW